MTASAAIPRAGRLDCVCEPGGLERTASDRTGVALLAAGFALSILSQVLTLSILPLAGLSLAPDSALATLPFTAFYAGAAMASLPASLLLDSFGRRAAFSLGASLGVAGGLVLVWALLNLHFGALTLGAFWLGIANGFSLFYRHAAVPMGGSGRSGMLAVFGAATLAALAAPTVATQAEWLATPHAFVGMAAAAALAHVAALACTSALPYRRLRAPLEHGTNPQTWRAIALPTAIGALAWALMAGLMGATPIAMIGCGLSEAVSGTVAWHVMAMYAPSLVLSCLPRSANPVPTVVVGCVLLAFATLVFALSGSTGAFSTSAILLGIGWSLATLGTTLWIHRNGTPSRWLLGIHDGALLGGALVGALTTGALFGS
ncbi:MFS transporter [Microvirga lenta]|uniref:MFS transporter n=1 Tax=Microvirga lenta TaxID=2881337 RepID=UPI001CFF962B|nr:MFS transporter [Microvirga lenta]MCB5175797.1 sugar porter family MFS transporter [Microvirga lenta]